MEVELVIARYSENLDWVRDVNIDTTIYSKSKPELDYDFLKGNKKEFNIVKVEKEMFKGPSHSYCSYLYNNFNKLKKNTIFIQARPWDHLYNLIYKLNGKEDADYYQSIHMIQKAEDEKKIREKYEKTFIDYLNSLEHKLEDEDFFSFSKIHWDGGYADLRRRLMDKCQFPINELNYFPIGEQFIVSRERIHLNKEEIYKDLLFWHENFTEFICHRTIAYVMERLWFSIFNFKYNG